MYCPYKPEELVPKDIEYFWPGVIAYGFPAYINGSTGLGKTNVFLKVMADSSNGIFPPGIERDSLAEPIRSDPIRSFYVSTENPVCEIAYPALLYNGADKRMFKIQKEEEGHFVLCMEDLMAAVEDCDPRLIIIDACQEHLPDGCSLSDGDQMSELMQELERFAYKTKVALVLIGNDAKGSEGRSDANKLLGSGVIARRARSLITVKESGDERYLKVTKRLGFKRKEDTFIGYRFNDDDHLEFYLYDDGNSEPVEAEGDVVQFIRKTLSNGPLDGHDLFAIGKNNGFNKDPIYKNLRKAGAKKTRHNGNNTLWYLPEVTPDIEEHTRNLK